MTKRVIFNVVHKHDEWCVMKAGTHDSEGNFKSKPDAVELARDLAMREEVGEVRILKMDGSIQSEFTFGKDPSQVEG